MMSIESLLLLNYLRYENMNGAMFSQIIWIMFLTHQVYENKPKIVKKSQNPIFHLSGLSGGKKEPAASVLTSKAKINYF